MPSDLGPMLFSLVTLIILASFMVGIAWRIGFLSFSSAKDPRQQTSFFPDVRIFHVILGFALYIGLSFVLAFGAYFIDPKLFSHRQTPAILFLINVALTLGLFYLLYILAPKPLSSGIAFGGKPMTKERTIKDLLTGALSWLVAFPCTLVASQFAWVLVVFFTGISSIREQLAIHHLQSTASSPLLYALTFISFSFLVPIIEETLFRGLLLNWIKNITRSRAWGIIFSAILFGLFHYSKTQGLSNIELILSLAVFGGFLGFIYEKQRSLIASIALHATFNLIALVRLLIAS